MGFNLVSEMELIKALATNPLLEFPNINTFH